MVLYMNLVLHQEGQRMPPPLGMCHCVSNGSLYETRGQVPGGLSAIVFLFSGVSLAQ